MTAFLVPSLFPSRKFWVSRALVMAFMTGGHVVEVTAVALYTGVYKSVFVFTVAEYVRCWQVFDLTLSDHS